MSKSDWYSCVSSMDNEQDQHPNLGIVKMERASSPVLPLPPKGRGRPRNSYAQTGEFDLCLIREYRAKPVLYDRTNKRFKDKLYTTEIWLQMARKLGHDACTLRDRMTTLRNRYNIEKRRVESSSVPGSQWPLYETLNFLSDHIRTRRSYKTQAKSVDEHQPNDEDGDEPLDVDDMNSESNGWVRSIKQDVETDYGDGNDYDCDRQLPVDTVLSIPHTHINGYNNNLMNGNCEQPELVVAGVKSKQKRSSLDEEPQAKRQNLAGPATAIATATTTTYSKFRAFGEFLSHSLNELPHSVAMRLITKFTKELVDTSIATGNEQKGDSLEQSSEDEQDD